MQKRYLISDIIMLNALPLKNRVTFQSCSKAKFQEFVLLFVSLAKPCPCYIEPCISCFYSSNFQTLFESICLSIPSTSLFLPLFFFPFFPRFCALAIIHPHHQMINFTHSCWEQSIYYCSKCVSLCNLLTCQ